MPFCYLPFPNTWKVETKPLSHLSASTFFFNTSLLVSRAKKKTKTKNNTKLAAAPLNCPFAPGNETYIAYMRQLCFPLCRHSITIII